MHRFEQESLGNWRSLRYFSNNFAGITNIKPASFEQIKISFDSIINENTFLNSNLLIEHGFSASIESTLIYSIGVIQLDSSVSKEELWERLQTLFLLKPLNIFLSKEETLIQIGIVELKFLTLKLPNHISLLYILFKVNSKIGSTVQCSCCLRFGHTQKFYRSYSRFSHCGGDKHSIDLCSTIQATEPICLFCKLPRLAMDQNCKEWEFQSEIKKCMAT